MIEGADSEAFEPGVLAFKSTAHKLFQTWNTNTSSYRHIRKDPATGNVIARQQIPMFGHLVNAKAKYESNAQGSWYNPVLSPARGDIASSLLKTSSAAFQYAANLLDQIEAGRVEVDHSADQQGHDGGEGTAEKANAAF